METKVQKWGNSLAIRIPKTFADDTNIQDGSTVDLMLQGNSLVVKPIETKKYSLESLLSHITSENIHDESDTGGSIGNEIW